MNSKSQNPLYTLTASAVDRYLTLNGWIRDYKFKNPNLMVFSFPSKSRKIAIPSSETFEDFYMNLQETLQSISAIEKKAVTQIIGEMSTVFFDRLEFRIVSDCSNDGKLPLGYASSCIEGLKELVLYSACAERDAQPVCFHTTNDAKNQLDKFKLAQTELGSFIINIDIKVVDESTEQCTIDACDIQKPFEHKIVERIYNAMSQVDSIVTQQKTLTQVTTGGYRSGITANMCESLLKMKPLIGDAEIDTTIHYASAITRTTSGAKHVIIKNNYFSALDEISKIYRNKVELQDVSLTGTVKSLAKHTYNGTIEKTIHLDSNHQGEFRTVTIDLNDNNYITACNAHRDGLEVEVCGTLDMSHKNWMLSNVLSFRIIDHK